MTFESFFRRRTRRWSSVMTAAGLLGVLSSQAEIITDFGVLKGRHHEQTSAAAPADPASDFGYFLFAVPTTEDSVAVAFVTVPGQGFPIPTPLSPDDDDPSILTLDGSTATQGELDSQFPNGSYPFTFIGTGGEMPTGSLTITGDTYPGIPSMSNYAASQDLDVTLPFTVQWPASGLGASDYILVDVSQDGSTLLNSPFPWQPNALAGTATSFLIPANTFSSEGSDPAINITFLKLTGKSTTALAGATGYTGYYRSTEIAVHLKGGGGGGDTTPPTLSFSNPNNGALNVPTTSPVTFRFSEAMGTGISIAWGGGVNAASFQYAWSVDLKTLTCTYPPGFPASSSISWILNPPGQPERFKDVAGNELAEATYTGVFITGTGGGPCQGGVEGQRGFFFISKVAEFDQTAAATFVPGTDPGANFFASIRAKEGTTITSASVKLPNGTVKPLQGFVGTYFLAEEFPTQAPLDTAYPSGNYQANVEYTGGGAGSLTVNMGANYPPTPGTLNFEAAQSVNANADFLLQITPFTGAAANDLIQLHISDDQGATVFSAPDECAEPPRKLPNTATSVNIPQGTLAQNKTYTAQLSFYKVTDFKTSENPAFTAAAMLAKTTTFTIKTGTGGGANQKPVITAVRLAVDGKLEADITGTPGRTITLQAGSNYVDWADVANGVLPAGGKISLKDPRPTTPALQVYRAESK